MCGRYIIVSDNKILTERFDAQMALKLNLAPNYNASVGQLLPVITQEQPNEICMMEFGLTPFWAKKKMYLFNARSEGENNKENTSNYHGGFLIINKPAFRKPIRRQKCLVLSDAFIEGSLAAGLDKPYLIYPINKKPFAMAGIYDVWQGAGQATYHSFAIITTYPNALMHKIGHHRCPVILSPEDEKKWLSDVPLNEITPMLHSPKLTQWTAYPISSAIKNINNNDPKYLQPQGDLLVPITLLQQNFFIHIEGMKEKN